MKRSAGLRRTPFAVPLLEDGTPRWSTLSRHEGLSRGTGLRSARLSVVDGAGAPVVTLRPQRRRAKDTGPSDATRKLVLERDGYACVCCGRSIIGQRYSLGHRLRASQGGKAVPSNLLVFLGWGGEACHGRIDLYRDPADEAKGYRIRSGGDPAAIPVMLFSEHGSGATVWLTEDGRYSYGPPDRGAA